MWVRHKSLVAGRLFVHDQGFKVVVRVPDGDEGSSELERPPLIERVELATREVQIDVLAKTDLPDAVLPVDIENFSCAQKLMSLGHELGFAVIGDKRGQVKVRDPVASVTGK
jgi:hypothetical protein